MAKTWHYLEEGAEPPPVDERTFVEHCRTGKIGEATMVWTQGMDHWQPYGELRAAAEAAAELAARKAAQTRTEADAGAKVARRACEKCSKDWPEPLMVKSRQRWLCRPCLAREEEAAAAKEEEKANQPPQAVTGPRLLLGAVAAAVAFYLRHVWTAH